jgi:tungstate transport system substrate-binding protein
MLLIITIAGAAISYSGIASLTPTSDMARKRLIVSTTTSLYDTGLLDILEYDFESRYHIDLYFISVGTGLAIQHAQRGDADVILVHAPSKEFKFMKDGYGVARKIIAYNFFIISGHSDDPAEVKGKSVTDALKSIVDAGRGGETIWVSRGDDSGTHTKEKELWGYAGYNVSSIRDEPWYIEAGSGMGSTLRLADEKHAYTLSDSGTYLKYKADKIIQLEPLIDKEKALLNTYSVVAVNPDKIKGVNFEGAVTFIEYLISDNAQGLIASFGQDTYQRTLFSPAVNLLKTNSNDEVAQWISEYAFLDGYECPPLYRAGQDQLYR